MNDTEKGKKIMSEKEFDFEHAKWLLEARRKNQDLLLRLYEFGNNNSNVLKRDSSRQELFAFLVGAAFSLWRAAFLSDTTRSWKKSFKGANDLLGTLIKDNAVTYPTDRKTREWMGGYYLNNAQFRLLWVRANLQHLAPRTKTNPAMVALDTLKDSGIVVNASSTKMWSILNNALDEMINWLSPVSKK